MIWRIMLFCLIVVLASISVHISRVAVLLADLNQSNREIINSNFRLADASRVLTDEVVALQRQIGDLSGRGVKERLTKKGGAQ